MTRHYSMAGKRHPRLSDVEALLDAHIPDDDARTGLLALFTSGLVDLALTTVDADDQEVLTTPDGQVTRPRPGNEATTRTVSRLTIVTPLRNPDGSPFERKPIDMASHRRAASPDQADQVTDARAS